MDIYEMHVLFRTLTQQMGMQKVRAILPESIDSYINESIVHTIQTELQISSTKVFKENITSQQVKLSPHNALTTLVCNQVININPGELINLDLKIPNILYLIDFSSSKDGKIFFKCRWIENDKLDETREDYCSRDTERHPIITVSAAIADISSGEYFRICNLYTGEQVKAKYLKVGYIRKPAVVKFVSKDSDKNVNCDLPEYLHTNIVETAIQYYMQSLGLTSNKQDNNNQQ